MSELEKIELEPAEYDGSEYVSFCLNNRERVEWYLRLRREMEQTIATIKAQAAAMVKEEEHNLARFNARFEEEAAAWAREEIERQGGKSKSVKTFQGTLCFRTVPGGVMIKDALAALEHAQEQGWEEDIIVSRFVAADAYKKRAEDALAATGEVLPGTDYRPARESFSVKFPADKKDGDV